MRVEFKPVVDERDILFGAEFSAPPRVGETVRWGGTVNNKRYRVTAVEYRIFGCQGHDVGAICTVEKIEGDQDA